VRHRGVGTLPDVGTWNELIRSMWTGSPAPAVITAEAVWDGDELLARAGGAACWLDSLGVAPGEVVSALVDESAASIALVVGATLSGRIPAPLGTKLTASDIALAVRGQRSRVVVADARSAPLAREAARLAGAEVAVMDEPFARAAVPLFVAEPSSVALIVHTSGTTGAPKPVPIAHDRLLDRIDKYARLMQLVRGDRYCSASQFSHTAGVSMVYTVLAVGAGVIPQDWFSVENWRLAGRLGVTCALLVPTMIDILLEHEAMADAQPRLLQYGASPIHPDTLSAAVRTLPNTRFLQIFGQTEVSPICALGPEDHEAALEGRHEMLATVGRPVQGVDLRVEDPDGNGIGQLCVRSSHCFVVDADGWRRTGDLGRIDAEGYVSLHGRVNDRIVRGGENIYPAEIEQVLLGHPAVRDAAVVGVPDRRWGEIVKAVVVTDDATVDADELRAYVRDRVAHFKVPARWEFADALPRNPAGKLLRRELSR
jgi:acyl-CoA synthetase (AMP-forming)/AMP-acid ligase II